LGPVQRPEARKTSQPGPRQGLMGIRRPVWRAAQADQFAPRTTPRLNILAFPCDIRLSDRAEAGGVGPGGECLHEAEAGVTQNAVCEVGISAGRRVGHPSGLGDQARHRVTLLIGENPTATVGDASVSSSPSPTHFPLNRGPGRSFPFLFSRLLGRPVVDRRTPPFLSHYTENIAHDCR